MGRKYVCIGCDRRCNYRDDVSEERTAAAFKGHCAQWIDVTGDTFIVDFILEYRRQELAQIARKVQVI